MTVFWIIFLAVSLLGIGLALALWLTGWREEETHDLDGWEDGTWDQEC